MSFRSPQNSSAQARIDNKIAYPQGQLALSRDLLSRMVLVGDWHARHFLALIDDWQHKLRELHAVSSTCHKEL